MTTSSLIICSTTNYNDRSFADSGPVVWNSLLAALWLDMSLSVFCRRLKTWQKLLTACNSWLGAFAAFFSNLCHINGINNNNNNNNNKVTNEYPILLTGKCLKLPRYVPQLFSDHLIPSSHDHSNVMTQSPKRGWGLYSIHSHFSGITHRGSQPGNQYVSTVYCVLWPVTPA